MKRERGWYQGRGFGLSEIGEEGSYLHPPQAWFNRSHPTCPWHQRRKNINVEKCWKSERWGEKWVKIAEREEENWRWMDLQLGDRKKAKRLRINQISNRQIRLGKQSTNNSTHSTQDQNRTPRQIKYEQYEKVFQ